MVSEDNFSINLHRIYFSCYQEQLTFPHTVKQRFSFYFEVVGEETFSSLKFLP